MTMIALPSTTRRRRRAGGFAEEDQRLVAVGARSPQRPGGLPSARVIAVSSWPSSDAAPSRRRASTAQPPSSWVRGTWPSLRDSLRLLAVGFSVFSPPPPLIAPPRSRDRGHGLVRQVDEAVVASGSTGNDRPEQQQGEPDLGREHHVDRVELRGDLGQQSQPEVGDEEHRDHRQRDLHGGREEHPERRDQHRRAAARCPGGSPSGRKWKVRSSPPMTIRWPPVTNSSMVASIWWNLPKTVFIVHRQRVEALGEREAAEDVDQAAGGRDRCEEQVASRTHRRADQHLGDDVDREPPRVSGMSPASPGRPRTTARGERITLAIVGTARLENGGTRASHATIRSEARR